MTPKKVLCLFMSWIDEDRKFQNFWTNQLSEFSTVDASLFMERALAANERFDPFINRVVSMVKYQSVYQTKFTSLSLNLSPLHRIRLIARDIRKWRSEATSAASFGNKIKSYSAPMNHFFEFRSKKFVFSEIFEKISFGATFLPYMDLGKVRL